jgi:hypothetical protein
MIVMENRDEKLDEKNLKTRELFRTVSSTDELSESFLHEDRNDKRREEEEEGKKEKED